ncbi:MAG: hypothetical protein ACLR4V_05715 [Bifidobacterium bifidum]
MSIHWIANNVRHINATATPMMMRDCGEGNRAERVGDAYAEYGR